MLSAADIAHYRTFGFVTLRGWLSSGELASINGELERCVAEAYHDRPFDGSNRHWVPLLTPKAPTFCSFAEERFAELAEQLLGEDIVLMMADGNRYVGDTPWHSDIPANLGGVKLVAYLDAVAADSGALRVVPGSHLEPLHSAAHDYIEQHIGANGQRRPKDVPAVALPSEPGDIVAFNPPIWHASVGGGVDRRMCTWDYFRVPRDAHETGQIRDYIAGLSRMTEQLWPERSYPFYDESWIANADGGPARARMIERMRATGIFAAAGK